MFYRTLKGKLFVAVILLGIFPFSLSVGVEVYLTYQKLLSQAEQQLSVLPLPAVQRIENLLYTRWNEVHLLTHMPLFRTPLGGEYQNAILRRVAELYQPHSLVALADRNGRVVSSSDSSLVNSDATRLRWFQEARRISFASWQAATRSVYISEPYIPSTGDGIPVMCFNSPIYDFEERFMGVLHSEINLRVLSPLLSSLRLGNTGRAVLVQEDGQVLLDGRGKIPSLTVSLVDNTAFRHAKADRESVVHGRDVDGDPALISLFRLQGFGKYPGVKWFLLVSQKESEIYAPIWEMLFFRLIVGLLGVVFIFLGGFVLFDRNISRPVARLMEAVRALEMKGLTPDEKVTVRSNDEIGELGSAFNNMVHNLVRKEEAQEELQAQMAQKERLATIGEMVAGVAHQIKNPLASIKVTSQSLLEDLSLGSAARPALARIDKEVNRLGRLLQAFFDFASPREPQLMPCSLQTIVKDALSQVEEERAQAGVRLMEEFPEDLPPLFLDPQQMLQVFINLFRNAVQAMPQGGSLRIAAEISGLDEGKAGHLPAQVQICVSDTGCGIKPEELNMIFRPFFTTRPSGTGLGLSLVYNVIQKHGGEVRVESEPGRGTTFEIVVPVKEQLFRDEAQDE